MSIERTPWSSGKWRWWHNGNHKPDIKDTSGRRDICSHLFYPAIGLYDAADPDYVEYHCQIAKMCGIDVLSIAAYPRDEWVDRMFAAYARMLPLYGLKATTRVQSQVPWDQMDHYLGVFGDATWRIGGRPVLTFFQPPTNNPERILTWKQQYPPQQRPYLIKWAATTVDPRWKDAIEGAFDWCGDDARHPHHTDVKPYDRYYDFAQVQRAYQEDVTRARKLLADGVIQLYIEGISPGFDNLGVNGWGKHLIKVDRADGRTYEWRWQQAIANGFSAVMIPTWDDWGENTTIQPTVEYGNQYLEITRTAIAKYKHTSAPEGNLSVPEWIYKIRKITHDQDVLKQMEQASELIRKGRYGEVEGRVKPIFDRVVKAGGKYWDPPEATPAR